jgi:hypothetical protein
MTNATTSTRFHPRRLVVADAELVQLAADRAAVIRGYMIEMQKVAPERIEVQEPDVNEEKGEWVRCKLALDGSD